MPIVYDGTEGGGHGDLFKGMKLFISYRVPQRERWVNLVKVRWDIPSCSGRPFR